MRVPSTAQPERTLPPRVARKKRRCCQGRIWEDLIVICVLIAKICEGWEGLDLGGGKVWICRSSFHLLFVLG